MPHETGRVNASGEGCILIRFAKGETHECIVDTGFNGALFLPRTLVQRLGLPLLGREPVGSVNRNQEDMDISLTEIQWLGEERSVGVIVSEGDDALIGTELLKGTRLLIDYVTGAVLIDKIE
jgi:clan AA aspartic protease